MQEAGAPLRTVNTIQINTEWVDETNKIKATNSVAESSTGWVKSLGTWKKQIKIFPGGTHLCLRSQRNFTNNISGTMNSTHSKKIRSIKEIKLGATARKNKQTHKRDNK